MRENEAGREMTERTPTREEGITAMREAWGPIDRTAILAKRVDSLLHSDAAEPAAEPMPEGDLAAWLTLRGVRPAELDATVAEFLGKTEEELDELYEDMHR